MKINNIPFFRYLVAFFNDPDDSMTIQTHHRTYFRTKNLHKNSFETKVRQLLTEIPLLSLTNPIITKYSELNWKTTFCRPKPITVTRKLTYVTFPVLTQLL